VQQGDAGAQFNLGESCHRASLQGERKDAPESRIEAYKWYRLASAQGYKDSEQAYLTLTVSMTREDVAAGNRRVVEFKVEKPERAHDVPTFTSPLQTQSLSDTPSPGSSE